VCERRAAGLGWKMPTDRAVGPRVVASLDGWRSRTVVLSCAREPVRSSRAKGDVRLAATHHLRELARAWRAMQRVHDELEARRAARADDDRRAAEALRRLLRDGHRAVAIHLGDDDDEIAPHDDRRELLGVTPAHAPAMELHLLPCARRAPRDLGLVPLQPPD